MLWRWPLTLGDITAFDYNLICMYSQDFVGRGVPAIGLRRHDTFHYIIGCMLEMKENWGQESLSSEMNCHCHVNATKLPESEIV